MNSPTYGDPTQLSVDRLVAAYATARTRWEEGTSMHEVETSLQDMVALDLEAKRRIGANLHFSFTTGSN